MKQLISIFFSPLKEGVRWNVCLKGCVICIICIISYINIGFAQKKTPAWFNLAIRGGYGNSILINNNIFDDSNIDIDYLSPSYSFGGRFGINFEQGFSIVVEAMSSSFGQNYDILSGSNDYTKKLKVKSFDKLLILRAQGETGGYFEVGPKFSEITGVAETNSMYTLWENTIENFSENHFSLVLGIGGGIVYVQTFDINMGIRISYAITNIMVDGDYPINDGVYDISGYSSYSTTNPLTAQIILEFNWHVGYFTTSKCKGGTKFLLF